MRHASVLFRKLGPAVLHCLVMISRLSGQTVLQAQYQTLVPSHTPVLRSAEFARSREGQPLGITNLELEGGRGASALRITAEIGGKPYSGLDREVGLEGRSQRLALHHNYRILEHRSNRQVFLG